VFYRAQSVENLGLAVVALLTGIIVDIEGYYMVELFFCLLLSGNHFNFRFKVIELMYCIYHFVILHFYFSQNIYFLYIKLHNYYI